MPETSQPHIFTAVMHKQLGDTVLLEPALHKGAMATGKTPALVCPPAFADLVSLFRNAQWVEPKALARTQSLLAYDTGSQSAWVSFRAKSKSKTLLCLDDVYRKWQHRFAYHRTDVQVLKNRYRAQYYWEHTPFEAKDPFAPPVLNLPPEDWRDGLDLPKHYTLVHATAAWQKKCWLPKRWAQTLNALNQAQPTHFVFTSGTADWEREHIAEILKELDCPHTNLAGKTTLRAYMFSVSQAQKVLCIDGSAFHLASAFKVPVLGLFGASNSAHWSSQSSHVHTLDTRRDLPTPSKSLKDLSVEKMRDAIYAMV